MINISTLAKSGFKRSDNNARALRWLTALIAVLAIVVIWTAAWEDIRNREQYTYQDAALRIETQAHVFAEYTLSNIKRLDALLFDLRGEWSGDAQSFAASIQQRQEIIQDIAFQVAVIDTAGIVAFSSLPSTSPRIDLSEREHFRVHADAPGADKLFISKPVKGKVSGKWSLQFTRPILHNGRFAGVLVVSIHPEQFSSFYRNIRSDEHGVLAIVKENGATMAHYPVREDSYTTAFNDNPAFAPGANIAGNFRRVSTFDDAERIYGYYTLPPYGLTVMVGETISNVLTPYFRNRETVTTLASSATVAVIAFAIAISLLLARLQRSHMKMEDAREQAENANRAKSDFLATMSHEIRTPMNGLIGTLELLEQSRLDHDQQQKLGIARRSSESLLRLLNDILDLSKIEAGKIEVFPVPIALRQKLEDLYHLNASAAAGSDIRLRYHVDPRISPLLLVDRLLLRQILSNFLSNAIKFTQRGEVTLAAEFIDRKNGHETIRISVHDTGIGISPEDQQRLFDPFVQAKDAAARSAGGTGLGLSICKRLTERMGGTIDLKSTPGVGTTISITLRLAIADQHAIEATEVPEEIDPVPARHATQAADQTMAILIVDDHPINRLVLEQQVRQLGHVPMCAENGSEGLAKWRAGGVAMIFTDCSMPEMDGYAMTQAIRAEESRLGLRRVPIIACTANAFKEAADACFACGMDAYLPKPLNLDHIKSALAGWLQNAPAHASMNNTPLDLDMLRELGGNNTALERQIVEQLCASNDNDAAELEQAVARRDTAAAARVAHRMAGANMTVGVSAIAAICRELMRACHDGSEDLLEPALTRLNLERLRLNAYLGQIRNTLPPVAPAADAPAMLPIADLSFLIVDDHLFQRDTLRMLLSQLGARRIVEAVDGQGALSLLTDTRTPIDIIISDLDMPNMDGMELIRHLSGHHQASLILSSALEPSLLASIATMSEAYGSRLLGVMQKPITREVLANLLAKHRSAATAPASNAARRGRQYAIEEIIAGMENGEFEAFFQPKIDLATGRATGAEALARWRHPKHGLVPPSEFIARLEADGPIELLTGIMLRQAVRAVLASRSMGIAITVAVNVSMKSLAEVSMANQFLEIVQEEGGMPQDIVLEITETAAATDLGRELENLARMRIAGFGLAIDDYGTGYSSMQQLTRIAFTELKIDRSFVDGAATHPASRVALETILDLAKRLHLTSVAEGVEAQEDCELLKELGCDIAQGYLLAKPMPIDAFLHWNSERQVASPAPASKRAMVTH